MTLLDISGIQVGEAGAIAFADVIIEGRGVDHFVISFGLPLLRMTKVGTHYRINVLGLPMLHHKSI